MAWRSLNSWNAWGRARSLLKAYKKKEMPAAGEHDTFLMTNPNHCLLLTLHRFFDDFLALGKAHAKTDQHVASYEDEQVFEDERHFFVVEQESGNISQYDENGLEYVKGLVLARLELREEEGAHHQKAGSDKHDDWNPEDESARVRENILRLEEHDEDGVDSSRKCGGESGKVVVVRVGIAGVVFRKAHGGAKYVNGKSDDHQETMICEPVGCINLVCEENAESRCESECNQVGEAIELGSEFGTGVYQPGGKTVKLVKKDTQDDEIGAHTDLVCLRKRRKCTRYPANGEYTQ